MRMTGAEARFTPDGSDDLYSRLMEARAPAVDPFDAHVAASLLTIAFAESRAEGTPLAETLGLPDAELASLVMHCFPAASSWRALPDAGARVERGADEACLLDLLMRCTTGRTLFQEWLAAIMARRAQRPNHLWQDLGLAHRGELSALMRRHFKPLAARNSQDMKWKKFLYRMICADAAYALCTAPSCKECDDFDHCFGDESGESLLARNRRAIEIGIE